MATHAGVALELGITRPSGSGMKMMSPQMEAILIWCQCRVREYEVGARCLLILLLAFLSFFAFPSHLYWNLEWKIVKISQKKEGERAPSTFRRCAMQSLFLRRNSTFPSPFDMSQTFPQGIKIENFTSCWADGTSFCALIHNFFPQAFDFKSINKSNRKQNYEIAFKAGE